MSRAQQLKKKSHPPGEGTPTSSKEQIGLLSPGGDREKTIWHSGDLLGCHLVLPFPAVTADNCNSKGRFFLGKSCCPAAGNTGPSRVKPFATESSLAPRSFLGQRGMAGRELSHDGSKGKKMQLLWPNSLNSDHHHHVSSRGGPHGNQLTLFLLPPPTPTSSYSPSRVWIPRILPNKIFRLHSDIAFWQTQPGTGFFCGLFSSHCMHSLGNVIHAHDFP